MPLSGGASDKIGNRYEGLWTVLCITEIMDGQVNMIRLEPPGVEGEGVEFWLQKGDNREYHQVKRQNTLGKWTISKLSPVLSNFFDKLNGKTNTQCVFVSSHAAYEMQELTERANGAVSLTEFKKEFLKTNTIEKNFNSLCDLWQNSQKKEEKTFAALQQIDVRTIDENTLRDTVKFRLATFIEANPENARDVLAQFALDSIPKELTAFDIWEHLKKRDFFRKNWANDSHVLTKIDEANARFLINISNISDKAIHRQETQIVLDKLFSTIDKQAVMIIGEAGVGKSGVISQVLEEIDKKDIPKLAFRLDRLNPVQLPDEVGKQLDLPASPISVLASIAQNLQCVLVIDQLDAVSLTSGRHPDFFDCINELIQQVKLFKNMRLLLASRQFDLDNDHRLRNLTGDMGIASTVKIKPLSLSTVKEVVVAWKMPAEKLSKKQLELLSIPLHLWLLSEIVQKSQQGDAEPFLFDSAKELYDRFWDDKQRTIRLRLKHSIKWIPVIDKLCDYMSNHQILSAQKNLLDEFQEDAEAMLSEHVLVQDGKRYAFFHEGFFDYAFARRFAARGWGGEKETKRIDFLI